MKDFDLRFVSARWSDADVTDLLTIDMAAIPQTGGVYVLGTTGTQLVYPWGTSPIYYIGQSSNLRKRLEEHQRYILDGRQFGHLLGEEMVAEIPVRDSVRSRLRVVFVGKQRNDA